MVAGIALIVAGIGLFLTARPYFKVADPFNKQRAEQMRAERARGVFQRLADRNARLGARGTVGFGRLVGAAAIVVGIVLIVRA